MLSAMNIFCGGGVLQLKFYFLSVAYIFMCRECFIIWNFCCHCKTIKRRLEFIAMQTNKQPVFQENLGKPVPDR